MQYPANSSWLGSRTVTVLLILVATALVALLWAVFTIYCFAPKWTNGKTPVA
jgi:hypothetical protein